MTEFKTYECVNPDCVEYLRLKNIQIDINLEEINCSMCQQPLSEVVQE